MFSCVFCENPEICYFQSCHACLEQWHRLCFSQNDTCPRCGLAQSAQLCSCHTQAHTRATAYTTCALFSGWLRQQIHRMKYSQHGYALAPTLAKLMLSTVYARNNRFSTWHCHNQRMSIITYVPTLPKKTITRGFYGVGLLASCLASHLTVSCMHGNLLRKKKGTHKNN